MVYDNINFSFWFHGDTLANAVFLYLTFLHTSTADALKVKQNVYREHQI